MTTRPIAKLFISTLLLVVAASCGDKNAQLGMPLSTTPSGGGGQGGGTKASSLGTGGLGGTAGSTGSLNTAGSTGTGGQGTGSLDAGSASNTGVDSGKGDAGSGQVLNDAKGSETATGGIVGGATGSGGVGGTGGTSSGIGGRDGGAGTTGGVEVGAGRDSGGESDARIVDASIADTSIVDVSVVDASIVDSESVDGDVADGAGANIVDVSNVDVSNIDVSIVEVSIVDGDMVDGSDASAAICNDIPNGGAVIPIQFVFAPLSTGATGGVIPSNGFYNLTKAVRYQSLDAGLPTVTSVSGTLYLFGTTLMTVFQSGSSTTRTMGDSTSFSATTMCGNTSCPSPGGFGCSGYTSGSNAFDQFVDMGNGIVQVNTWTPQP